MSHRNCRRKDYSLERIEWREFFDKIMPNHILELVKERDCSDVGSTGRPHRARHSKTKKQNTGDKE